VEYCQWVFLRPNFSESSPSPNLKATLFLLIKIMKLEFDQNVTAIPHIENENSETTVSTKVGQMLREGIKAAQEGRRTEAKEILLRVTEVDQNNENAWMWLASISEYPEELLIFLSNVLKINPDNERALEWKRATQSLLAKTLVQRGIDASNNDRKGFARQCFEQAIEQDAENEMAWLWLASVSDSDEEKSTCFEKVLSINPENQTAKSALKSLRIKKTEALLLEAICAAVEGEHQKAQQILAIVLNDNTELEDAWVLKAHLAESFEERAESLLKIKALNPENEMAKAYLASWRALAEKVSRAATSQGHQLPTKSEAAPFIELSESNFSGECEPEQQAAGPAKADNEQAENFTEEHLVEKEYATSESPTQELDFVPFSEKSLSITEPESKLAVEEEILAIQSSQPEIFSEPDEKFSLSFSSEENYSFESQSEVSAESNEDECEESKSDSEYFTTQPESFVPDTEQPERNSEMSADSAETISEAEADKEWKNTSPQIFIGYKPQSAEILSGSSAVNSEKNISAEMKENQETSSSVNNSGEPVTKEALTADAEEQEPEESLTLTKEESSVTEKTFQQSKTESLICPFCSAENERQVFSCHFCHAVLTLSDLESLFGQTSANEEILRDAVESLEREHESFGLNAENLVFLGIGYINLKDYQRGMMYLREAVRMNPDNVILEAQVNAFSIRLAEIERQQSIHDSMPKKSKILVVDDSPTVRKLISGKLAKCGHEVICAVDGLDALEKLKDFTPDLILLDITMPRMDGYQVCKEIRSNETMKNVPVVMISGKDGFFDKVRGRMAGTSGYITKPFGPETLMKTIETYIT
jgi:twitching motility two-component system response regulator PilG